MDTIDLAQQEPAEQQPAAGWYPSATDPMQEQYWDGSAWTDQSRPLDKKAAKKAAKEAARQQADLEREAAQREREHQQYLNSPPGKAKTAFANGDHVFQYSINVMAQDAIIVSMVGSTTQKTTHDPVEVLNAVCREGWEVINGDFVFVEEGQQSRDKFLSSGQNVAIKGKVLAFYLFKRCEANRVVPNDPA
jgi:Protein of unknown function (DUF2510)